MSKLNWDTVGADWSFSYNPQILEKPFSGKVLVTCAQTEPTIRGTIQPLTLTCQEDIDSLEQWFEDGERLVRCPLFYRAPVTVDGFTSYYDNNFKCIRWTNSPYSFSGGYYVGANADSSFNVINPSAPVEWKVKIAPVNRGYRKYQPKRGQPLVTDAIEFTVLPRVY